MFKFKTVNNYLVNTIIATLMSFSLFHALGRSLNFIYNPYYLLAIIFLTINVLHLIFLNKFSLIITSSITAAGLIAGAVYLYKTNLYSKIPKFIQSFINWLVLYVNWEAPLHRLFSNIILAFLLISVSIFIFIFTCKRFKFFIILIAGLAIFVPQWIFSVFVSFNSFYIFIFVICLYYLKHVYINNSNRSSNDFIQPGTFLLWSAPFCAVVVALALLMPSSPKPLEWKWLDEKIVKLNNYFFHKYNTLASGDFFSLNSTGFGNSENLGGKVRLDKTKVLKVESPRQVYLKAVARDLYTGASWKNSVEGSFSYGDFKNRNTQEFNETLEYLNRVTGSQVKELEKYYSLEKVKVTYLDIYTKSLFLPSKANKLEMSSYNGNILVDSTGSLFIDKKLGSGFNYSFQAYSPKYSNEEFIDLLKKSKKGYYYEKYTNEITTFNKFYSTNLIDKSSDGLTYNINNEFFTQINNARLEQLRSTFLRLNEVYSRYLQLPENLPPRIGELAKSLTNTAPTEFEKVKAIEEYLSKNFPYTLSPKKTPKNRDFVDFFLFDSKEGYCSYFASAMTVMARSIGIPARYVEGYVLPPKTVNTNTYEVTNEQAHAWVEVYFEGYGWLPFEPTSPFRSTFYSNQDYQGIYDGASNIDPAYLEYMERLKGYNNNYAVGDLDLDDEPELGKWFYYIVLPLLIFVLIVLVFLSIIIYNHFKAKLRLKKFRTSEPKEAILASYSYYLKLIALNDLKIDPGETPIEFSARVDRFLLLKPEKFKTITEVFLKARYSLNATTDNEKEKVLRFYEAILNATKAHLGKFKFFTLRYLLGKI